MIPTTTHSTMRPRSIAWRRAMDRIVKLIASLSAMVGLVALAWILCVVIGRGASALNWSFFTQVPRPPGVAGGGLANAILGTLAMTGLGALIGVPLGLLAGVVLAEFG
jgi:phosphate transport system permease protein